jgi:hypothetical protein
MTPKLLVPGDYDALAEHFKRQTAERLRLFAPPMALALEDSGARSTVRTTAIQGKRAVRPWVGRHCIADLVASHPARAVRTMAAERVGRNTVMAKTRQVDPRLSTGCSI